MHDRHRWGESAEPSAFPRVDDLLVELALGGISMSKTRWLLWLGASAVALTSSLPGIAQADEGEIVVTAQRRSENIQNVPVTVTAVTDQQVKDLRIFRIEDVQSLSPGLALESQGAFGAKAQLRGVGFDADSSGSPAVDIYYNETPVDANYAFQAIYDVGQIEVLRGPQGTPAAAQCLRVLLH